MPQVVVGPQLPPSVGGRGGCGVCVDGRGVLAASVRAVSCARCAADCRADDYASGEDYFATHHAHSDEDDYTHMDTDAELFPHYHADAFGNIVAYSNGRAVLICRAERKPDAYTTTTPAHGRESSGTDADCSDRNGDECAKCAADSDERSI